LLDASDLFLRNSAELESILRRPDQYDYLRAAAILRSLLLDDNRLIDAANRSHKVRLRYRARDVRRDPGLQIKIQDGLTIFSVQDGLYPPTAHNADFVGDFTHDQFLKLLVGIVNGEDVTVRDIILYAANKLGGVHYDERGGAKKTFLRKACNRITLGNMSIHVRQIGSIASIVLDGTRNLREAVKSVRGTLPT